MQNLKAKRISPLKTLRMLRENLEPVHNWTQRINHKETQVKELLVCDAKSRQQSQSAKLKSEENITTENTENTQSGKGKIQSAKLKSEEQFTKNITGILRNNYIY